jgi:hypothetical protein
MDMYCDISNDFECANVIWHSLRKARKEHVCIECREKIQVGEKYHNIDLVYEGSFEHYKICHLCYLISKDLFCHNNPLGYLREFIKEYLDFDYLHVEKKGDEK